MTAQDPRLAPPLLPKPCVQASYGITRDTRTEPFLGGCAAQSKEQYGLLQNFWSKMAGQKVLMTTFLHLIERHLSGTSTTTLNMARCADRG